MLVAAKLARRPLDVVEAAARHEETRARRASLSAVQERHDKGRRNRPVEIGIVEQDRRRLTAQFERDALHGRGAIAHDPLAHAHRARERNLVDVRITRELSANHVSTADHDVAYTHGKFGRIHAFKHHLRLQRTEFTGLEHDRTTSTDGRC